MKKSKKNPSIMKRIKANSDFLKATTSAHPEQCKALLQTAKQPQLDSICEILLNIVRGTIELKEALFVKVKRYKTALRHLITKCGSKKNRKELMVKYSGIVQKLLAAALPVLGLIFSGIQMTKAVS